MLRILLVAALVAGVSSPATAAPGGGRASIPLPGGVAALAAALELTHPFDRAHVLVETTRIVHENPPGDGAATDLLRRRLLAHVASLRERRADTVDLIPLPLTSRVWSDVVFHERLDDDEIALAILENREAALVHAGLSALDAETLEYLANDRDTLERIARRDAALFAAFGRSLKIRDGRLVVPGGEEARELWSAIADASPDEPGAFFLSLLESPGGRLAFLYDTAASLDPPAARFLLGLDLPPAERAPRFAELARVFLTAYPSWHPERRPFSRPTLDGALLFRLLRFDDEGRLAGPVWPALWTAVFEEREEGPEAGLRHETPPAGLVPLDSSASVDAAWLAGQVLSPLAVAGRPRMETLLFAQRVFGDRTPADAPALVVALRGALAFPALARSLERLGSRDPDLYARATRRAASLSAIGAAGDTAVALAEFQSLLAIIERARVRGSLDGETACALASGLIAIEPDEARGYQGAIARWIDAALLPALFEATAESIESSSAERAVIGALAGPRAVGPPEGGPYNRSGEIVEWEGRRYRIDPAVAERARLEALRANQLGNDLDQVLAFCRAAAAAAAGPAGATEAIAAAAATAARGLQPATLASAYATVPLATPQDAARTLMERASRGDTRGAGATAQALVALGDALLADALTSIAYALDLGEPDGPALASGNVALRHDFGLSARRVVAWQTLAAWEPPTEEVGGGWHVRGSLLGLDVALARFALRGLAAEGMPPMPALNANERRTFTESAALIDPRALDDGALVAIAGAIERGRRRVNGLVANPAGFDGVADDARLSGWRREAVRWAIANDPETVPRSFSRLELLWLGGLADASLQAWGMSAVPLTGCWCVDLARPGAWEEYAGRPMTGQLATRMPDLNLRTVEEMVRLRLPAALVPGVLKVAANDLIYEAQPAHYDDWLAVVRYVDGVPAERFLDYVSALTAGGPLAPAGDAKGGHDR